MAGLSALRHARFRSATCILGNGCTATDFLPKGEITAGGVIGSRLLFEFAVYGGTGLYDNVRGTLTVTSLGLHPPKELLLFRLMV